MSDASGEQPAEQPGEQPAEQPDLLAQATAAQPITHSERSHRHRRRRRRGPSPAVIIGIVAVVLIATAATVIVLTHKNSNAPTGGAAAPTWAHADMKGRVVTITSGTHSQKFVTYQGLPVPAVVASINTAASKGCSSLETTFRLTLALAKTKGEFQEYSSAYAAYALQLGKQHKCGWTKTAA